MIEGEFEETALTLHEPNYFIEPVASVDQMVTRYKEFGEVVKQILVDGRDFGEIPGTNKPTLLKPGAEKLLTFFGLQAEMVLQEQISDMLGDSHGGEPYFYYRYACILRRGDLVIASSEGSCNSWEKKYRYRNSKVSCPNCKEERIAKSQYPYKKTGVNGWYCHGCKAQFPIEEESINSQEVGKVPNPDIFDTLNTLEKMAQKRALINSTLLATNASEFFTQDTEDMGYQPSENATIIDITPKDIEEYMLNLPDKELEALVNKKIEQRIAGSKPTTGKAPAKKPQDMTPGEYFAAFPEVAKELTGWMGSKSMKEVYDEAKKLNFPTLPDLKQHIASKKK